MNQHLVKCFAVGVVALLLVPSVASAQRLVKAEFTSKTANENKNKDTGLYVTVATADGGTVLADITNADNSPKDSTEYRNGSEHSVKLVIESTGSTKADCQRFKFKIGLNANGNDTWRIERATVMLTFDDGTTLRQEATKITIDGRGDHIVESEWLPG